MTNTRNLYSWEAQYFRAHKLTRPIGIAKLRKIAAKFWPREKPLPTIIAGPGLRQAGRRLSYCMKLGPVVRIELARNQRNVLTLLHEMTHALGYWNHGPGFVKQYFAWLAQAGVSQVELELSRRLFKLG